MDIAKAHSLLQSFHRNISSVPINEPPHAKKPTPLHIHKSRRPQTCYLQRRRADSPCMAVVPHRLLVVFFGAFFSSKNLRAVHYERHAVSLGGAPRLASHLVREKNSFLPGSAASRSHAVVGNAI